MRTLSVAWAIAALWLAGLPACQQRAAGGRGGPAGSASASTSSDSAAAASSAVVDGSTGASASKASSSTPSKRTPIKPKPRKPRWKRLAESWVHPRPIPNFELTNQDGRTFRVREFADGYVLVGFIFTTCGNPKACPLTTEKMRQVGKLWRERDKRGDTKGKKLRLLTLTIDPENDTPKVLASYGQLLRREFPAWTFATGPEELMQDVLPGMFGVLAEPDGKGDIAHTVKVALLGPALRPLEEWKDNRFEPKKVVELVLR
jgi:cytochrome oxidase Cu insertion factor (SCO1/SenC/PrrC family)